MQLSVEEVGTLKPDRRVYSSRSTGSAFPQPPAGRVV
jgi:hypothetical protein